MTQHREKINPVPFRGFGRLAAFSCALLLFGCGGGSTPAPPAANDPPPVNDPPAVSLEAAFPNLTFTQPLLMLQPTGDFSTWFVVERGGVIRAFDNDPAVAASRVFADLSAIVDS